jgi:hypothetical protein
LRERDRRIEYNCGERLFCFGSERNEFKMKNIVGKRKFDWVRVQEERKIELQSIVAA